MAANLFVLHTDTLLPIVMVTALLLSASLFSQGMGTRAFLSRYNSVILLLLS